MKIYRNNLLQQWAMSFFFGESTTKPLLKAKNKSIKNADTVKISWQAKREMRSDEIKKMIDSGEPLKGVTYEEFLDYYSKYKTSDVLTTSRQGYIQALNGDNASLRQKEWRYNPEYEIPVRLYDSPEVTADREAAIEKYRRGEELTDWEKNVMYTFQNGYVRESVLQPAEIERKAAILQNKLADAFSKAGIQLGEEDEITFEAWGKSLKISGNVDEDTINAIYTALEENKITGHSFQGLYYMIHTDESRAGGFSLGFLRSAEDYLRDEGSGVTVFDLSLDGNRNVIGLPKALDELIKKDAIGEFGTSIPEMDNDKVMNILKARYIREAFRSAVDTIQNGDYDRLRAMTSTVTYKNGILSC